MFFGRVVPCSPRRRAKHLLPTWSSLSDGHLSRLPSPSSSLPRNGVPGKTSLLTRRGDSDCYSGFVILKIEKPRLFESLSLYRWQCFCLNFSLEKRKVNLHFFRVLICMILKLCCGKFLYKKKMKTDNLLQGWTGIPVEEK